MARWLSVVLGSVALATTGCGLVPVPYVADVTGPIAGLRVLDAETHEEIAGAHASFRAGIAAANWMSSSPPRLAAVPECDKTDLSDAESLTRDAAGVFRVEKRHGLGFIRPFGIGPLGWALYNPPIGVIWVLSRGYHGAELVYYAGAPPQPGWSEVAALPGQPDDVQGDGQPDGAPPAPEAVRCELGPDGILRFYLRRTSQGGASGPVLPGPDG